MTRPVQEPTVQRALSNQEWGILQLQRRPAPTGFVIPTFRAQQNTFTTNVPTDNEQDLNWDEWENNDVTVFNEGALVAGNLFRIELLQIGVYILNCSVTWEGGIGAIGEPTETSIILNDGYDNSDIYTHARTGDAQRHAYQFSRTKTYPVFMNTDRLESSCPPYAVVFWKANQTSAGAIAQDTEGFGNTAMEIMYLGRGDFTPTYPT